MSAAGPERPLPARPGSAKRSEALPPRPFAPGLQSQRPLPRPTQQPAQDTSLPRPVRQTSHSTDTPPAPSQAMPHVRRPQQTPPQSHQPVAPRYEAPAYDPYNLVQPPTYDQPYAYAPTQDTRNAYQAPAPYAPTPYQQQRAYPAAPPHAYPGYHPAPQPGAYPGMPMPGQPLPAFKRSTKKSTLAFIWAGAAASVVLSLVVASTALRSTMQTDDSAFQGFDTPVVAPTEPSDDSEVVEDQMPPAPPVDEANYVGVYARDDQMLRVHRFASSNWREYGDSVYTTREDGARIVFDAYVPGDTASLTDQTAFLAEINTAATEIAAMEGLAGVANVSAVETNGEGKFRAVVTYHSGGTSAAVKAATVFNVSADHIVGTTAVLVNDYYVDDYDQMLITGLEVRV